MQTEPTNKITNEQKDYRLKVKKMSNNGWSGLNAFKCKRLRG